MSDSAKTLPSPRPTSQPTPFERFSKNAFWFGIAIVGLITAFAVKSPYMAFSIYSFLLLITISHFSSVAWLSGLDCERTLSRDTLRQGEEVDVAVTIANRRGWPIPWIFVEDIIPPDFPRIGSNTRLSVLMPGRSVTLTYSLQCPRRGYHRIGPLLLESGDLFGLQKRFRTGERQDYISVLPTVAYIETFNIASRRPQGPVRISNRIYEDPTRISGLREYVPGDPLNKIHWKVSARLGRLFTKQNEPANVLGATLILDLHGDSYAPDGKDNNMELAITTTASIAYLLHVSGEQVGMLTNARDAAELARYEVDSRQTVARDDVDSAIVGEGMSDTLSPLQVPTARSPIQAQRIIENLARVVEGDGLTIEDLILSQFRGLPRDASMLPVVPYVSGQLAQVLAEMKISGFAVSVFLINNRKGYEEAVPLLAPYGIRIFHIEHERHLHELSPDKIGR